MYCTHCGAQSAPEAAFCARCGATFGKQAPPAPLAQPVAPLPPPRARLDVGDALGGAFRQAFTHFGQFLGTQGVFVLIAAGVSLLFSVFVLPSTMSAAFIALENEDFAALLAAMGPLVGAGLAMGVLSFVLTVLGAAMGIVVADGLERGEALGFADAWRRASPRLGNLMLTSLLVALAAIGAIVAGAALFFLIVPVFAGIVVAVYLFVRWAVAGPVSVLESRSVTDNLRRAATITAGSRGPIFVCLLLLVLLGALPGVVVTLATEPDTSGIDPAADPAAAFEAMQPSPTMLAIRTAILTAVQLVGAFVGSAFMVRAYRTLAPTAAA